MSQMQVRQLQSRSYEGADTVTGMKAVIAAFQDEGYLIDTANETLGLITAYTEIESATEEAKLYSEHFSRSAAYEATQRTNLSGSVSKFGDQLRVRINIVQKAINQHGGVIWSVPIQNAEIYQRLFSRIDKSMFLAREKL